MLVPSTLFSSSAVHGPATITAPLESAPSLFEGPASNPIELLVGLFQAIASNPFVSGSAALTLVIYLGCRTIRYRRGMPSGELGRSFVSTVFSAGLCISALVIYSTSDAAFQQVPTVIELYGKLAILFLVLFVAYFIRFSQLVWESWTPAATPRPTRSTFRRPLVGGIGALCLATCLLLALLLMGGAASDEKEELAEKPEKENERIEDEPPPAADNEPERANRIAATREHIREVRVDPNEAASPAAGDASGEPENGQLPPGLSFDWSGSREGWEPAFVRHLSEGRFEQNGIARDSGELERVYAVEGPAVRPWGGDDLLFFHRDVLRELNREFAKRPKNEDPVVHVIDHSDGVALRIPGDAQAPSRTLVIRLR